MECGRVNKMKKPFVIKFNKQLCKILAWVGVIEMWILTINLYLWSFGLSSGSPFYMGLQWGLIPTIGLITILSAIVGYSKKGELRVI